MESKFNVGDVVQYHNEDHTIKSKMMHNGQWLYEFEDMAHFVVAEAVLDGTLEPQTVRSSRND